MDEIGSACTRCGKCFQVCPMTEPAAIKGAEPTKVLSGIVDILRGNAGSVEAEAWRPLTRCRSAAVSDANPIGTQGIVPTVAFGN
jgi:Fe-S oxidoreductase